MAKGKISKIIVFGLFSALLGAGAGAICWMVFKVMNLGISGLWKVLPEALGMETPTLVYTMAVCVTGGIVIGLWQKKMGALPEELEEVMGTLKKTGSYTQYGLHILAISALLPLIFGGTIGPEAGLTGLIVALCCHVGDNLKYRGHEVASLAEAGMAATLGVIFNAPLFGIINNIEPDDRKERFREKLVSKKTRLFIYFMGVAGAMASMNFLSAIFGGGAGLPKFAAEHNMNIEQWKWFIPMIVTGLILGLFYLAVNKATRAIGKKLLNYRILSCVIAGVVLACVSYFIPYIRLSGEGDMEILMEEWEVLSPALLITVSLMKLLMVNVCINLGWRGGSIFPIIFACTSMGYAFAAIVGISGPFAVACICAATYAVINRKPFTVVAVLLLCFPLTYILPLVLSAVVASKIPVPKILLVGEKNEE